MDGRAWRPSFSAGASESSVLGQRPLHGLGRSDQLCGLDAVRECVAGCQDRMPENLPAGHLDFDLPVCSLPLGSVLAVISVGSALLMGLVWFVRAIIRKLGTLVYWAQRAAGGVPEAADAEFLGPGTGRIPETADLRSFKKTGTADKWVLLKREGKAVVFKVGTDTQTIKTAGLYVPVEADTMRGDQELVDTCRGHDKVHLRRSLTCAEDGQHFKEYGIARDFDPEKFHLKNAELGAAKAGRALWAWLWSSPPKKRAPLKEYASESETEPEKPCEARRVVWVDKDGDYQLAPGPCKRAASVSCTLLLKTSTTRVAWFRCVLSMRWTTSGIVVHMGVNTQAVTGLVSWMRMASGVVDFMEADEDLPRGGGLLQ